MLISFGTFSIKCARSITLLTCVFLKMLDLIVLIVDIFLSISLAICDGLSPLTKRFATLVSVKVSTDFFLERTGRGVIINSMAISMLM